MSGIIYDPPRPAQPAFCMRYFFTLTALWVASLTSVFAAEGGEHHIPAHAEEIFHIGPFVVTNSMITVWIVAASLILVAQLSTRKMAIIPGSLQNVVEWMSESLYGFLESILGQHLVKRTFWFFYTIFVMILFTNWFGLIPGVGTIGIASGDGSMFSPYLRGGNADLNMTAAMGFTFALLWFYWAITENGLKGFLHHIFAPKGVFAGVMAILMMVVFAFVGVLEVISILFRPVALSFRLYGNVFAGENILENMMKLTGDKGIGAWLAWLPPIPFYFLELLVGLIQALVFMLLTSVFLRLMCEHSDHAEEKPH